MVQSSYRNPVTNAADKLKEFGSENWMSAWNVILVAIVFAILIALVHYYTVANLFNTGEMFNGIGWVSTGGGLLFFFIVALMIGSAGAAFGMSWKKNSDAAMWSIAAILVLGLLTFYMFASARDERKDQFVLWTGVSIIASIGIAGYGFWSMRGLSAFAKANSDKFDEADKKAIPQRYTYSMAMLGVSVVSAITVIIGTVSLYRAIPNQE
jgi:hypothetical protein